MKSWFLSARIAKTIAVCVAIGLILLLPGLIRTSIFGMPELRRLFPDVALQISVFTIFGVLLSVYAYYRQDSPWWIILPIGISISFVILPMLWFFLSNADGEGVAFYQVFIMPINFLLATVGWLISKRFWQAI
jgi:hypothetical protein